MLYNMMVVVDDWVLAVCWTSLPGVTEVFVPAGAPLLQNLRGGQNL